ncbi:MAG: GTPase Era [Candidatus Omnitrophica bacterium]|nr:GTPase Era [Candidatus Omnitrophota bacterium]
MTGEPLHSGFVALIGPTNSGKSTLLNRLVGEKIAIVSSKPQTTRSRILGILNRPEGQIVFVDTPGLHTPKHLLGKALIQRANQEASGADLILYMLDTTKELRDTEPVLAPELTRLSQKKILLLNKVDKVSKPALLPLIERYSNLGYFEHIFPISAIKDKDFESLLKVITSALPESPALYGPDQVTDQSPQFRVTEIIREKVLACTHEEVPHSVAVEIEGWNQAEELLEIQALIHVERDSQKGILIGKDGRVLKRVGTEARRDIEALLGNKVFLQLWVKVLENWRKNPSALRRMGYS